MGTVKCEKGYKCEKFHKYEKNHLECVWHYTLAMVTDKQTSYVIKLSQMWRNKKKKKGKKTLRHICKTCCLKWNKQKLPSTFRSPCITSLSNQLTLKCTARSARMHCKEKEQKNQLAGKVHDPSFKLKFIFRKITV